MPSQQSERQAPAIFRLPLELRQLIYAELLPAENTSHPFLSVGITSVDHRPPSAALLSIHPIITDEVLDYFYSISTWKLVLSHAFNFFRIDPELQKLEQSPALKCMRKVEVVFFCDVLLLHNYPSFGLQSFCAEIKRRAARASDVLCQATSLQTLTVSWCDSTDTGNWDEKAKIVQPLLRIPRTLPRVEFRIGKISAEDVDEADFAKTLQEILGAKRRMDVGLDGASDVTTTKLRLLAFDPRQERLKVSSDRKPGAHPVVSMIRKNGWKVAPPVLRARREQQKWEGKDNLYSAQGAQQIGSHLMYAGPSPA